MFGEGANGYGGGLPLSNGNGKGGGYGISSATTPLVGAAGGYGYFPPTSGKRD
jgi:hypothetical protein